MAFTSDAGLERRSENTSDRTRMELSGRPNKTNVRCHILLHDGRGGSHADDLTRRAEKPKSSRHGGHVRILHRSEKSDKGAVENVDKAKSHGNLFMELSGQSEGKRLPRTFAEQRDIGKTTTYDTEPLEILGRRVVELRSEEDSDDCTRENVSELAGDT